MNYSRPCALIVACLISQSLSARGVSPYLPLNLDPEMERQIELVLMLADKPVLKRPIAAAAVLDALPRACPRDPELCAQVRRFLGRYMHTAGLTHAEIGAIASDDTARNVANRYGRDTSSSWEVSANGYWQPSDHVLLSLGVVAYEGETLPEGSALSVGFSRAQLDIGYRPHSFSPMTESSMLIGTNAATMPSVTLSNYVPLTRWGVHYEAFLARMSSSDTIALGEGFTSGSPSLAGLHLSIEPASGWSFGVNRLMQYGGGERGGNSLGDVFDAFFRPSRFDNVNNSTDPQFGNQLASATSRFLFPGRTPFAVYFEYAGEDTSNGEDYLLGNSALSAGIEFPRLWRNLSLTYEATEWQNGWYINSLYGDGLTNRGHVIGHWFGDEREFDDAVGGQSHMINIGWRELFGGVAELRLRTLENEDYSTVDYQRAHDVLLRYSRVWKQLRVGGEVFAGEDVFGRSFSTFGVSVRYAPDAGRSDFALIESEGRDADPTAHLFVDAGVSAIRLDTDITETVPVDKSGTLTSPHIGIGARRAVSDRSDLGARIELDRIDGNLFLAVRAIDYRYRMASPLAINFFLGAARYDVATPAYGMYLGAGVQWRDALPGWDLGLDARYALKVARDHLLPEDPQSGRPDTFYDVMGLSLSVSRRF